jgi:two-component system, OmpR family, sensor histidine kinase CreC
VSTRSKVICTLLVVAVTGFYLFAAVVVRKVRPWFLQSIEESLVDTATILAEFVRLDIESGRINTNRIEAATTGAASRKLHAQIYGFIKERINTRVYVTDQNGIVLFDSAAQDLGKDFSRWNDIARTMQREYGARSTRTDSNDDKTSTLFVAAPVIVDDKIAAIVSVGKRTANVAGFINSAKNTIILGGVIACVAVIIAGALISFMITRPIEQFTKYVQDLKSGVKTAPPDLGRNEVATLLSAFEELRTELEGRDYVEHYVQALTHELKSPLAGIRGASELLKEEMPVEQRMRFSGNIRAEVDRMQSLIERLLQLAKLERSKSSLERNPIELNDIALKVAKQLEPQAKQSGLTLSVKTSTSHQGSARLIGDRQLIEMAVSNLVSNAIDFSEPGVEISINVQTKDGRPSITVTDSGVGIPDYALPRVFERFYSLGRPAGGKKSSGLGLSLVKEIAEAHGAKVSLSNREVRGVTASIEFPRAVAS